MWRVLKAAEATLGVQTSKQGTSRVVSQEHSAPFPAASSNSAWRAALPEDGDQSQQPPWKAIPGPDLQDENDEDDGECNGVRGYERTNQVMSCWSAGSLREIGKQFVLRSFI